MFSLSKWMPPDDVPMAYNFLNTKFKYLIAHEGEKVNKSYEVTKEHDFWKNQRDITIITEEVAKQKHNEDADYGLRMKLHQSEEMQNIKKHLRSAHIKRYVAEQQTAYEKKLIRIEEARVEGRKRAEWYKERDSKFNRDNNANMFFKKKELRDGLLKQLEDNKQKIIADKQLLLVEHDYQNAMKKKREAEDRAKRQKKLEIATQVKDDMNFLLDYRAELKRLSKNEVSYYSTKTFEYLQNMKECRRLLMEENKRRQKEQENSSEMIGKRTYLMEQQKLKDENRLIELWINEYNRKVDDKVKEKYFTKMSERTKLMDELEKEGIGRAQYNKEKRKWKRDTAAKERQAQAQADAKNKREKDEENYWRSQAHGFAIRTAIDDHRLDAIKERADKIHFYNLLDDVEKDRQKIIQEERCKLMQAVEPGVLRYLRNGVVNSKDLEYLSGDHHKIVAEILYRKGLTRSQYLSTKSQ